MFSLRKSVFVQDFGFNIYRPIPNTKEYYVSRNIVRVSCTIKVLDKDLQTMFTVAYNGLVAKMLEDKKKQKLLIN